MKRVWFCCSNINDLYNLFWALYVPAVITIYYPKWIVYQHLISVIKAYSQIDPLKVQSAHTNFEISRSNSKRNSKFDPKFDLSDLVDSFAISDKPIE